MAGIKVRKLQDDLNFGARVEGLGWDNIGDPWDPPATTTAKALDITPARARLLLDALAVPDLNAEPINENM